MKGDYLRVHHSPKRFPMINQFDWGKSIFDDGDNEKDDTSKGSVLPGVIVKENPDAGYIIVNKPPGVPVHPTVGEYIIHCIIAALCFCVHTFHYTLNDTYMLLFHYIM